MTEDGNAMTEDENRMTGKENRVTEDDNRMTENENRMTEDENAMTGKENAMTEDGNGVTGNENAMTEHEAVSAVMRHERHRPTVHPVEFIGGFLVKPAMAPVGWGFQKNKIRLPGQFGGGAAFRQHGVVLGV